MALPTLTQYQGKLNTGPAVLAEALDTVFTLAIRAQKLYFYASLSTSVDTTDQAAAALLSKVTTLQGQVQAARAFVRPELLAIGAETLRQWASSDAALATYSHYFEDLLRSQAHVRSAEVEELLGLVADPFATPNASTRVLTNAELHFASGTALDGKHVPVSHGSMVSLISDLDRQTRQTTWESYQDGYLALKKTLAKNLEGAVKQNVFLARARGYRSALEASLAPNNVPAEVYHNVIQTFRRNLPVWHRYWALRKRVSGYQTLHTYDLRYPLTTNLPHLSFKQAVDWISDGLQPLGSEYVEVLRRGCLEERWVDYHPNLGKTSGAFSSGCVGMHPFIVMSFDNSLKGMSTLAHELGHSMHSYLTWQTQPLVYSKYSLFVAEVASNFNQAMVRAHLLKTHPERDLQIALLDEAMSNFHRYYFTMPILARFELEMYQRVERGEALTADVLNGLFAEYLAEGYGDAVAVDAERDGITWATFPHMFMNFYVFQYNTGIAGAHALAHNVLTSQPEAVERYLEFLRTGGARYPLDALQRAGVDLSTPEPIETAFAVLEEYVARLEELTATM
jgi:oligoendopeptidase F